MQKIAVTPIFTGVTAILLSSNCQRRDISTNPNAITIVKKMKKYRYPAIPG